MVGPEKPKARSRGPQGTRSQAVFGGGSSYWRFSPCGCLLNLTSRLYGIHALAPESPDAATALTGIA